MKTIVYKKKNYIALLLFMFFLFVVLGLSFFNVTNANADTVNNSNIHPSTNDIQLVNITGRTIDSNNEPIIGAEVYFEFDDKGIQEISTKTLQDGTFKLEVNSEEANGYVTFWFDGSTRNKNMFGKSYRIDQLKDDINLGDVYMHDSYNVKLTCNNQNLSGFLLQAYYVNTGEIIGETTFENNYVIDGITDFTKLSEDKNGNLLVKNHESDTRYVQFRIIPVVNNGYRFVSWNIQEDNCIKQNTTLIDTEIYRNTIIMANIEEVANQEQASQITESAKTYDENFFYVYLFSVLFIVSLFVFLKNRNKFTIMTN